MPFAQAILIILPLTGIGIFFLDWVGRNAAEALGVSPSGSGHSRAEPVVSVLRTSVPDAGDFPQEKRPARKGRRGDGPRTNGLAGNASQQRGASHKRPLGGGE
jgi:hypothetical protein